MFTRRKFFKRVAVGGLTAGFVPLTLLGADNGSRAAMKNRVLRLAHITDVHILDKKNAETCFSRALRQINELADRPDWIINTGDTVMDENKQTLETVASQWNTWNTITRMDNSLTIKSCLGNHDVWNGPDEALDQVYKKDRRYGKQWAIDELSLSNRYYSFEQKGWKFIALDSINGESGYQLDDAQFAWLSSEVLTDKPILIYSHVPILSMGALLYTTKRKPLAEVRFPSGDMHNDHQRLKDLFAKKRNVKVCLSGHVHYIDATEYLGVRYLCNGAMSGNWWGDPLSLDEFPPVFTVLDLFDDGSSSQEYYFYNTKT